MALNYDCQSFTKKLSAAYFLKKKGIFPLAPIEKTQGKQLARNFAQEIRRVSMIAIPVIETQKVPISYPHGITLYIKREDKTHVHVSGNKYRKLKYNLLEASQKGYKQLITFGGAYSNHIAATAYAGKIAGIETIGVIRGDELASAVPHNPTLSFAKECGMRFHFVSRERFRLKHTEAFKEELANLFGPYYYVPEGGTNALAIKGTEEILTPEDTDYDFITTAVGTGGTIAGLINSALPHQKVLGFPALCGKFLEEEIKKWIHGSDHWQLIHDYNLGGYAKVNESFIRFLNDFFRQTRIPLDPVYTGKMIYGVTCLIEKGFFPENSKILAIHTGGLQGIYGMNQQLSRKKKQTLDYEQEIS